MASIRRFEDVQAWQKARQLVSEVYKECADGSIRKDFGLRDQLCRAAVSTMSNIAEGFARRTDKDFARFLDMARGSAAEVQSLLYMALDSGYLSRDRFGKLFGVAIRDCGANRRPHILFAPDSQTPHSGPIDSGLTHPD
jgi:four helix bundle protein